jgi:hypothetical protein
LDLGELLPSVSEESGSPVLREGRGEFKIIKLKERDLKFNGERDLIVIIKYKGVREGYNNINNKGNINNKLNCN